jgi:4-hydroxybenzoate polyprenyl transferase
MLSLFTVGAFCTRSAGCVINDFADRDIDKHVARTKARPLTTGELSTTQAGLFLAGLMAVNFSILFSLPLESIKYGLYVTPIVFLYPTTKRYFKVPQFVLGLTFNSGVFIGYSAVAASLAADMSICLPFYIGGIAWTIIYDTIYAF